MADPVSDRPNPSRQRLLDSTRSTSPLEDVAKAVSVYTENPGEVYVEHFAAGWRWSPAHRGGSYPLLRVTARFLQVDHSRIVVPFRTVNSDWAVLMPEPEGGECPEASAILVFDEPASPAVVAARITTDVG